jgi:hypothetical protein
MVEKLLCVEAAERKSVRDAAAAMGLDADCKPVRCWRRSDLVAERSPRLTTDMILCLQVYRELSTN